MKAASVLLLLLLASIRDVSTASFSGGSSTITPPQKKSDGTFRVCLRHRLMGRSGCQLQSSLSCEGGACTSFNRSGVVITDRDRGGGGWCQTEEKLTATVLTNKTSVSLRHSGCCWVSNVEGKTNWTSRAELNLGTRSDSHTLNSCPVTTAVSNLRIPQNCFSRFRLLAHDPDGDKVRCRFTADAGVPSNFTLDQASCTLASSGPVEIGIHVFEILLEDFPSKNITLTYADRTSVLRQASNASPLCSVPLQFSVQILPPITNCEAGHVQPMFLSTTPSHGDVLYARVGQNVTIKARAQAHHASIYDFQVSGPQNMSKEFRDEQNGKAELMLSWTPLQTDLYRFLPVCFTAETNQTQSEIRCVVVMVTQSSISQGKASVECSPNKMVVVLEKASMPGIDENFLKLRDQTCSLTSNSTHIMGSMSFSTCGTKLEDKGDFIVFKNEINSFELPSEVIIRRKTVKIEFSCQFPKTISISSFFSIHQSDYIFTESSFGSFGYTFEIFRDGNFSEKVEEDAYPVEVKLLQMIYLGIQARADQPNLKLFVESCKAMPNDDPENKLSYDLIKNGCVQDETLKVHPANQTAFNFEVQAFKFTGNYDQVYISCSVLLCDLSSPFSRCAQGCLKEPSRRRRRALSRQTVSHYITQGPLLFVRPTGPFENNQKDKTEEKKNSSDTVLPPPVDPKSSSSSSSASGSESDSRSRLQDLLSSNLSTAVFTTLFLLSLAFLMIAIVFFRRKKKVEDHKSLIDSGWES